MLRVGALNVKFVTPYIFLSKCFTVNIHPKKVYLIKSPDAREHTYTRKC